MSMSHRITPGLMSTGSPTGLLRPARTPRAASVDTTPPTYLGATINPASAGNGVCDLLFSEAITSATSDYESGFTIGCRQPSGTWLNLDATKYTMVLSGTTKIRLTLTGTVNTWQASHELRVSYSSVTGNIKDLAGNALVTFSNNATLTNSSTIDLLASLVERWSLGEASGTRVASITTPGNDLTDVNTVLQGVGKLGNAADFERDNDERLSLADNAAMSMEGTDCSIGIWVNFESQPGDMGIISKWGGTTNEYALTWFANNMAFFIGGSAGIAGITYTTLGTWAAWQMYHDTGTEIALAVNDGAFVTEAIVTGISAGDSVFILGAYNPAAGVRHHDGLLDEPTIWKRLLSAAEWTDWVNGGTGKAWPYLPDHL